MRKNKLTRVAAAAAGASLIVGLAACSSEEAKENVSKATDTVSSVASEATEAAGDAKDNATDAASDAKDKVESAFGGKEIAQDSLPAEIVEAAENFDHEGTGAGEFVAAEDKDGVIIAQYENATFVKSDEGTYPVIGGMLDVWTSENGPDGDLGVPTAAEQTVEGGWEQTFTGKVVHILMNDEAGKYEVSFS